MLQNTNNSHIRTFILGVTEIENFILTTNKKKKKSILTETAWPNPLLTSASINQTGWIYAFTHFRPGRAGIVTFGCELWEVLLLTMPWNTSQAFYSTNRSAFSPWCDTDAPQRGQYFRHNLLFFNESRFMLVGRCGRNFFFSLTLSVRDHLWETFQHVVFSPAWIVTLQSSPLRLHRRQTGRLKRVSLTRTDTAVYFLHFVHLFVYLPHKINCQVCKRKSLRGRFCRVEWKEEVAVAELFLVGANHELNIAPPSTRNRTENLKEGELDLQRAYGAESHLVPIKSFSVAWIKFPPFLSPLSLSLSRRMAFDTSLR